MRRHSGLSKQSIILSLVAISCFGCMLEEVQERGDVCPPGTVKTVDGEKVVSFGTLDCYADYIVIPSDMGNAAQMCRRCSQREDEDGTWECSGDLTSCLDSGLAKLRQDYAHCRHYRDHGVLDAGSDTTLGIAFVHNQDGMSDDAVFEANRSARTCPGKYSVCTYDASFVDETREDETEGAYGCTVECSGGLLYCGEGDARRCVNPQSDSEYCGAKGSCSGPSAASSSWIGEDCTIRGMVCDGGSCVCRKGTMQCGDGDVCVDVMGSVEHCGDCNTTCGDGEICVQGVCSEDRCANYENRCFNAEGECRNSVNECGASCADCEAVPHVREAECSEDGQCVIKRCKENYHIYRDDENHVYECRKNTLEWCAPPDSEKFADRVDCTQIENTTGVECQAGKCVILGCQAGFVLSNDQKACVPPECTGCNSETERCFNGICRCADGYTNCGSSGCVQIIDNLDHCGACGNSCRYLADVAGMKTYDCVVANCEITECEGHFFITEDKKKCQENDDNNCGEVGRVCSEVVKHTDSVSCNKDTGKCEIGSCEAHYHIWVEGEECEEDTKEHCGDHEHSCWIEGASEVDCLWDADDKPYCVTQKCKDGYHLMADPDNPSGPKICEADTIEHCGEARTKCPTENAQCIQQAENSYVCECDGSLEQCGDQCVDLNDNRLHCNACNHSCAGDLDCINGSCGCKSNTQCGDYCIDIHANDKNNCGECGKTCPNNQICDGGNCGCGTLTDCGGTCIDIYANDKNNCGGCGNKCPSNQTCTNGVCGCGGLAKCGDTCIDIHGNDKNNCGGCGIVCPSNQTCSGGVCGCGGLANCNGTCINTLGNDKNNCGGCGVTCPSNQSCSGGSCGCPGSTNCSGTCINIYGSDSGNCGGCGSRCSSDRHCSGGNCVCNNGWDCSGSCVDVNSNPYHCGGCNRQCGGGEVCSGGNCVCSGGTFRCNGSCVSSVTGKANVSSSLRVRPCPYTDDNLCPKFGSYGPGASITVIGYTNGSDVDGVTKWYIVLYNGMTGYVSALYVSGVTCI